MAIDREATLKNAEKFLRVGRLDAAIVEYARVVEEHPRDWNTANALGDLYMRAGQSGHAVPLYSRVADHLLTEGFYPKAAALFRKILKITPDDEAAQLRLAEISARQGLLADARAHYSNIEKRRRASGDSSGADEIVVRLGALDPDDLDARLAGAAAAERRGQLVEAAEQYRQLYDALLEQGREHDAHAALRDSIRCSPASRAANLLPLARIELCDARYDAAAELLAELVRTGADGRRSVEKLAWELVDEKPEAAARCVEAAVDGLLADGEFSTAATLLQQYSARVSGHLPTLLKLVEVCVDGSLEELAYDAQALLADAYLAHGKAAEARVIAEDLVARDPRNAVHVARLRRALEALNVENVESVIGELNSSGVDPERGTQDLEDSEFPVPSSEFRDTPPPPEVAPPAAPQRAKARSADTAGPAVSPAPVEPSRPARSVEIDLTTLLGELQGQAPLPEVPPRPARDLEAVFAGIRAEAGATEEEDASGDHFDLARTYLDMGMPQDAIGPLQMAARSPRYRFAAASMLGELYRDDGDLRAAIDWFERAAEAPAPEAEQGLALLYDLADLLETVGETARSLAVFLELDADAPGYRDVRERAGRLSRIETEG